MEAASRNGRRDGNRSRDVSSSVDGLSAWCHTASTRAKVFTHRWTIDDFERKTRTCNMGDSLCSNTFTLGTHPAAIKIFPTGTEGNKNHVSIFLENKGDKTLNISEIDFTFVPPVNSTSTPLSWNAPRKELDPEDDWGFQRFISVQKLKDKKLVSDKGELEILTKITREYLPNNVSFSMSEEGEESKLGLGPQLWEMYLQSYLTDYTLICDGLEFPCHKFILGSRSDFFRGLLSTDLAEARSDTFEVTDMNSDTLRLVLEFLYTGGLKESPQFYEDEDIEMLMSASDFYVIPGLKRLCEEWLIRTMTTANMVNRLITGDTYSAFRLRKVAKDILIENSIKLDLIPDWKKKLGNRTELILEVLGELAKSSL